MPLKVAVLGLGGMGTAAARFLARSGCRVVGFEQFHLDHDRGSSYGGSRIIRRVYPDPLYARLMDAAYPLWRELEAETGQALLLACGGFFYGPEGHPEMTATEAALREVGVPYQALSQSESARRFPQFRLREDEYGLWEPESGLLRASRCVLVQAEAARALGAELREGATVHALEPDGEGVRLRTAAGWERFDRLVLTGGPWTGKLLAPWLELPLRVTRQHYAHFRTSAPAAFAPDRFPIWIDMAELLYGFPEHDQLPGIKIAPHVPGPVVDPDAPRDVPGPADEAPLLAYLQRRIPAAAGEVTFSKLCLYTMTPDEDFVVGSVPGLPSAVFVGGLSGHGFKFTILLGQLAARLAQGQDPGHPLHRFRPDRFSSAPKSALA